jgi:hypothetical protein
MIISHGSDAVYDDDCPCNPRITRNGSFIQVYFTVAGVQHHISIPHKDWVRAGNELVNHGDTLQHPRLRTYQPASHETIKAQYMMLEWLNEQMYPGSRDAKESE